MLPADPPARLPQVRPEEVTPEMRQFLSKWNAQQMLDFLFTVGAYVTVAGVMRSTGVERKQELIELAEQYGQPE